MNTTQFERLARDPQRTRAELENMKANALAKGQAELANIANEVLRERFSVGARQRSGSTPTTAVFRSRTENFGSGKEAYLWLVEQFCSYRPDALERYTAAYKQPGAASKGCRFAKDPSALVPDNSSRKGDPSYFARIAGGWCADTNLSHKDKFAALLQLSSICGLEYNHDWEFQVSGATVELLDAQRDVATSKRLWQR